MTRASLASSRSSSHRPPTGAGQRPPWRLLGLALVLGGGAAFLGHQVVRERLAQLEEDAQRGQDLVEVIVASRDLAKGDVLGAEVLAVRAIPKQYAHAAALPPAAFAQIEQARLQVPLQRGEALLQAHIDGLGQRVFSTIVQKGMRALTVEVDDLSSNAGMLRPGDRIDLIYAVTPSTAGQADERRIQPLLSNVPVMATGQSVTKQDARGTERRYTNVTLEVTPADANRILLAKSTGDVSAILRHPDDVARNDTPVLTPGALVGGARRSAPAAAAPARGIEYVIGGGNAGAGHAGGGGGGGGGRALAPVSLALAPDAVEGGQALRAPMPPASGTPPVRPRPVPPPPSYSGDAL
jgi:pilus assembly protein CpaB